MSGETFFANQRKIDTPSGSISYVEQGDGPVALFVHGVLLNAYLWRHQLEQLQGLRRCIAVDLLAHGNTEISATQDVSVTANAHMLAEFLDALKIEKVDLVGNDSGGGVCQIFAALYPNRIHSLVLTNCDTHDNWPPEAFKPFIAMVAAGGLLQTLNAMLADKSVYRSAQALGPAYERPQGVSDDTIETYLRPHLRSPQRIRDLERFVNAFDCRHTVAIEELLKQLQAPTLIAWGTDDIYFDLKWSHWLEKAIPGTRRRVELQCARIFFPEERASEFNAELKGHWSAHSESRAIVERGDPVKVSFFGVPKLPQLEPAHVVEQNNLKVASLLDLAGTKASVIQVRAEAKDYLDLDALMRLGEVDLATALAAANALYGPTFNPEMTLKALSYFDDGNLRDLPNDLKLRLVEAAREVDLDHLPVLGTALRRADMDNGLE